MCVCVYNLSISLSLSSLLSSSLLISPLLFPPLLSHIPLPTAGLGASQTTMSRVGEAFSLQVFQFCSFPICFLPVSLPPSVRRPFELTPLSRNK